MTVEVVVALIGTGTVSVVAGKLVDLLVGKGKRERELKASVLLWETEAVRKHTLALRLYLLAVEAGVTDVPPVPDLPRFLE